jgi:hypothetical protein
LTESTRRDIFRIQTFDNRKLFPIFVIMVIIQVVELIISVAPDIFKEFTISLSGISLFVAMCAIYIFGQFFILGMVKAKNKESEPKRFSITMLEKTVTGVQYFLSAVVITIIVQIMYSFQYNTGLLAVNATISYGLAGCLTGVLAYWLFSWFRISRTLVVLLYGLAATMIAINAFDSIILFDVVLINKPSIITPESETIAVGNFPADDPMNIVATVQAISLNAYYLLAWGGTIILLYHNIRRIGKTRFWILVTTPMLFFMSFYVTFYLTLNPPDPTGTLASAIIPLLIIIFSAIAAMLLFGAAFYSIARSVNEQTRVRDYMIITAYGIILFFLAAGATITGAGFPPFGILNVSLVGPFSFLILIGLYRSAISIAEDAKLRQSVKGSQLLQSIGSAEMQREIENKFMNAIRRNAEQLTRKSGIEPSLTDEEIESIAKQAAQEIQQRRKNNPGEGGKE